MRAALLVPALTLACDQTDLGDRLSALETAHGAALDRIEQLEERVDTLEQAVADAASELDDVSEEVEDIGEVMTVDPDAHVVRFTGVNVQVVSGSGATDGAQNGLGNLIVGYDEGDFFDKVGTHNLVVGPRHVYTSFSGLVAGSGNTIASPYATVTGGAENTASATGATVTGGRHNAASSDYASVHGGTLNVADGTEAAVLGGWNNRASGEQAIVAGGQSCEAEGQGSAVGGGSNVWVGDVAEHYP